MNNELTRVVAQVSQPGDTTGNIAALSNNRAPSHQDSQQIAFEPKSGRGRPRKFADELHEEALKLKAAGKNNRHLAAFYDVELDATAKEARAASALLSSYKKRRSQNSIK